MAPDPRRIAVLGDAAGTVARAYGHYFPPTRVDAVELDGELSTIGRRYFDLRGSSLHLYTADARPWLQASGARYDSTFLDAYRQPYTWSGPTRAASSRGVCGSPVLADLVSAPSAPNRSGRGREDRHSKLYEISDNLQ